MDKKMISSNRNWLNSIRSQVVFYQRSNKRPRNDPDFRWEWIDPPVNIMRDMANRALNMLGLRCDEPSLDWLNSYAEQLWESRSLLNDELSKLLFDATIVLRLTGHQKFYFPRINFDDLFEIVDEEPFDNADLPRDILGVPLKIYDIRLRLHQKIVPMKIVSCKETLNLLNSYRQYLVRRNSFDISPAPGDIVLDCGSCIGDMSLLFAGFVAMQGEVHLFDPIPLHARYCRLQASLNPSLAHVIHINQLAVSNRTYVRNGDKSDSEKIVPGGLAINSYASTSLDDYVSSKLSRVDFIKMDIEGAEMDAIAGAAKIIRKFKPRLAISAYHRPNDLWEIPMRLKSLNQSYEIYFEHHCPVWWESVFYAVQP
jgi:FkbM family methyltransferase